MQKMKIKNENKKPASAASCFNEIRHEQEIDPSMALPVSSSLQEHKHDRLINRTNCIYIYIHPSTHRSVDRYIDRLLHRSMCRPICRSLFRWMCRSADRAIYRWVNGSVEVSISILQCVDVTMDISMYRYINRPIGRHTDNSVYRYIY